VSGDYDKIMAGLLILSRYQSRARQTVTAEHDTLWAGHNLEPDRIPEEDQRALKRAGWAWDEDVGAWRRCV
jgi:hypothetical protein